MGDPTEELAATGNSTFARPVTSGVFILWSVLAVLALILAVGAVATHLLAGPRFDWLLMVAACVAALLLAFRIPSRVAAPPEIETEEIPTVDPLQEILDSAGPALVAIGPNRRLSYVNPAAERLLGYDAADLMSQASTTDLLAPGEGARLVAEMQKLCGIENPPELAPDARMTAYFECVRTLPPSMVPSFDAKLRRKDGSLVPVTLHISARRGGSGAISGLVAVAVDQTATLHQERGLRESQERYRDLFENSSEMMATLSPAGRFLYANPAWKRCFGLDPAALLELNTFEDLFGPS
jgi:PAS domain-containing protein